MEKEEVDDNFLVTKETKSNEKVPSLQENFSKFLEEKRQERRLLKSIANNVERNDDFKQSLRKKFIDRAKSYFGVPYSRKYQSEDTPVSPLYLDCCGLIRQCVRDLQSDFGFVIGKWNQAYQYDTLPIRVDSVDKLKPGDLIFYSGEYTSDRSKKQKHDMVHVEIFYGGESGEATIGARFSKGVVQVWPSYKFSSTLWKLHSYHYCSIDSWLEGHCKSYCSEHEWKCATGALALAAGERSIFNDQDDATDSGDESAGDCCSGLDDVCDDLNGSSVSQISAVVSDKVEVKAKKFPKRSQVNNKAVSENHCEKAEKVDSKSKINYINSYYVCKSNGWRLVSEALNKRGWHQLPFDYSFSTRFALKWVERRSQIDYKAHHPGQLVNHIINNDVLTTKNGLLASLRDYYCTKSDSGFQFEEELGSVLTRLMHNVPVDPSYSCPRISTPWLPESYQLDSVVDCVALLLEDIHLSKVASRSKSYLQNGKQEYASSSDIVENIKAPMSVVIPTPPISPLIQSRQDNQNPTHLWIYKPSASNRGRGVRIVRSGTDLIECVKEYHPVLYANGINSVPKKFQRPKPESYEESNASKEKGPTYALPPPKALVQKYLMSPLLVDGFKFDLRCYLLITRTSPTYKAYYHPGYCRRTLRKYTLDPKALSDEAVHLSNVAIQKKLPDYKERIATQVQLRNQLAECLKVEGDEVGANYVESDELNDGIKQCMIDCLKAGMPNLQRRRGYFDLLGFDFMITSSPENELVLIEINTNPSLSADNPNIKDTMTEVVDGTIELVLRDNNKGEKSNDMNEDATTACEANDSLPLPSNFSLVFHENVYEFVKPCREEK